MIPCVAWLVFARMLASPSKMSVERSVVGEEGDGDAMWEGKGRRGLLPLAPTRRKQKARDDDLGVAVDLLSFSFLFLSQVVPPLSLPFVLR